MDGKPLPEANPTAVKVKTEIAAQLEKQKVHSAPQKGTAQITPESHQSNVKMLSEYDGVTMQDDGKVWRVEFAGGVEELVVNASESCFESRYILYIYIIIYIYTVCIYTDTLMTALLAANMDVGVAFFYEYI